MSKGQKQSRNDERQLATFYRESRRIFGQQYRATGQPWVLVARDMMETSVEQGLFSISEAANVFRNPSVFAQLLLQAEKDYQEADNQRLHEKMESLKRNTDWKVAAGISLAAGSVTGLAFAVASPFITAWLQPTADEMFKRRDPQHAEASYQPNVPPININGDVYYVNGGVASQGEPRRPAQGSSAPSRQASQLTHK